MVLVPAFPGETVPQSIDAQFWVHPESLKIATFTAVRVPDVGTVFEAVSTPDAASVRNSPVIASAITVPVDALCNTMPFIPYYSTATS